MKRAAIVTLALCLVAAAPTGPRLQKPDFSVTFPAGFPTPEDQPDADSHQFISTAHDVTCIVGYWDREHEQEGESEGVLKVSIRGAAGDDPLTDVKSSLISNCHRVTAMSTGKDNVCRYAAVSQGRRIYLLIVQGPARDAVYTPAIDAFFDSFTLAKSCR